MAIGDDSGFAAAIRQIQATTKPPALKLAAGAELHGAQATMHEGRDHGIARLPLGFRRKHVFADPCSLATWLRREGSPDSVEVLVGEAGITATLAARDVEADVVTVALTDHPAWARWGAVNGKSISHPALHKLLRVAAEDTVPPADRGNDAVISAGERLLAELGKLEVTTGASFTQEINANGMVTLVATNAKTEVRCNVPPVFRIHVPLYVDVEVDGHEPVYEIGVTVSMDVVNNNKAMFTLEFPDLPLVLLQARKDVARCLEERLGEGWYVGLGEARQELMVLQDRLRPPSVAFVQFLGRMDRLTPDGATSGDCDPGPSAGEAAPPSEPAE